MAEATRIRVNDAGVAFLITVKDEIGPVNLTTVTNLDIYFQKPDKSVIARTCDTVNASSGLIRYTSQFEDFDQAGRWKVQVVVKFANGNVKHSDIGNLYVDSNIFL